jgi:tRNA pseudouridine38-40 synthase
VWADAPAPPGFHATHDATAREYTYHLHAPAGRVDDGRARGTLGALTGEHDFRSLTPDDEGTVRELAGSLERDGTFLVVRLRADGFPRQLVRRLVSLVAASARRGLPESRVERVLSAEPLSGPEGVAPAPAEALVLSDVAYPLEFAADGRAAADAREWFRERRAEAATGARVAGHVAGALDGEDI